MRASRRLPAGSCCASASRSFPVAVRLIAQDGGEIGNVGVEARDDTLVVTPPGPLVPGGYFLSYRVTSLDAHAVGATLRFGVGAPAPGAPAAAGDGGAPMPAAVARWLTYVTALGAAGAALFLVLLQPPRRWPAASATSPRGLRSRACWRCCCAWAPPASISGACRSARC